MDEPKHCEECSQQPQKKQNKFVQRAKALWNYFTTYEKIWYVSILVLALVFAFIFPEEDTPTQVVTLNNNAYVTTTGEFDTLSFEGTVGEFVIDAILISNENDEQGNPKYVEYSLIDFTADEATGRPAYAEHTIIGQSAPGANDADATTLTLKLPVKVTANSSIKIDCYQDSDGDDDVFCLKVVNGTTNDVLYSQSIVLEAGEKDAYSITNNRFLVSAAIITFLYLLDVILNITCELLISKQSKWNFIVSLGVEVVEILVCVVCMYRFATMVTTLLFWIPCDIISFVLWHRHPDKQKEELTVVKKLTWWQDIIIILGIAVWTVGVGYLLTLIEVDGGIFGNNVAIKNIVCYIDACASAVGMANGILILLRYREQWLAWYICAILETVINIMAGQWILLILKLGYLTNTTYGYITWTRYIRNHAKETQETLTPAQA